MDNHKINVILKDDTTNKDDLREVNLDTLNLKEK